RRRPAAVMRLRLCCASCVMVFFLVCQSVSCVYSGSPTRMLRLRCLIFVVRVRAIQVFARRQIGVFFEMLRSERFDDGILLIEPFAEVNELAALRAERAVAAGKPVAFFPARRAFDFRHGFHGRNAVRIARREAIGNSDDNSFCPRGASQIWAMGARAVSHGVVEEGSPRREPW